MVYKQRMSRTKNQQEFKGEGFQKPSDAFGGALLKGNAKRARPLDLKWPIHLTMRATKSVLRTPKYFAVVEKLISTVAKKHGVKIFKRANVGNHLHLAIQISHVRRWAAFIRELTGRLGLALKGVMAGEKLWLFRPHTRIVRGWKKAFQTLLEYVKLNQLEAAGFLSRKDFKTLKDLRDFYDEISNGARHPCGT